VSQGQALQRTPQDPERIVLGDEIIEAFWQQRHLLAIFTFYESLHPVNHAE
jgi:hypothetical protein